MTQEDIMKIGYNIKKYRENKGLTVEDLEKKTGIPKSVIWIFENNRKSPKYETLNMIAKALNIKLSNLLEGTNLPNEEILAFDESNYPWVKENLYVFQEHKYYIEENGEFITIDDEEGLGVIRVRDIKDATSFETREECEKALKEKVENNESSSPDSRCERNIKKVRITYEEVKED